MRTLGSLMPVAIDTSTVTDFVNDHPAEAYAIAGAIVLLLILFLLVRSRRAKESEGTAGGSQLSRKDARRAKKEERAMVKADAKSAKEKERAESKQAKVDAKSEKKAAKAQAKAGKKSKGGDTEKLETPEAPTEVQRRGG